MGVLDKLLDVVKLNDDYDDEDDESSGLEKAITIGGFIIGAIIIVILIYFIARAAGLVKGLGGAKDNSNSVSISSESDEKEEDPDAGKVAVPDLTNKTRRGGKPSESA